MGGGGAGGAVRVVGGPCRRAHILEALPEELGHEAAQDAVLRNEDVNFYF